MAENDDGVSSEPLSPRLEVDLSRSKYKLGDSVVGTVRLLPRNNETCLPRNEFRSARLCIVAKCRIDSRWHNPTLYHTQHNMKVPLHEDNTDDCTVWATNVVDLLELPERPVGRWRLPTKALKLPPENPETYFTEEISIADDETDRLPNHLAITFRVHLPADLPPSVSLTCCRYYYLVLVEATTLDGRTLHQSIPFFVASTGTHTNASSGLHLQGECIAMAHSTGLACHISADDIYSPQGQTTILYPTRHGDTKTMRVADPQGAPCCILTAFGSSVMIPGGTLLLQLDFIAPCHQVAACLQGHETALRSYSGKGRQKTRSHLFDTAYELVEAGFTDSLSLSLQLPLDCPVTIHTDLVEVEVSCRVDITTRSLVGKYSNLTLELPVIVVHEVSSPEEQLDDQDGNVASTMEELLLADDDPPVPSNKFETKDILSDLKILSLLMVKKCGLIDAKDELHEV